MYNANKERGRRQLVATMATDLRFKHDNSCRHHQCLQIMTPNMKSINFAHDHTQTADSKDFVYCPATDTPSTEALRLRQDLSSQHIAWLNRHDRESGDLYGMLPLMFGMPVAVTEHIHRSYEKNESSKDVSGTLTPGYLLMMKKVIMNTMCEYYINCRKSCSRHLLRKMVTICFGLCRA